MTSLHMRLTVFLACLLTALLLTAPVCAEDAQRMLLNGSFEYLNSYDPDDPNTHAGISIDGKGYTQLDQSIEAQIIWAWKTTAAEHKIELFRTNKGVFIPNVTLNPSDGSVGAELNADEESTLYQVVNTEPLSLYEWGLDHGSRSEADTMALIIGPNQTVAPGKPAKDGKDQFMQMVDWLKGEGRPFSTGFTQGIERDGEPVILYSAKFAEKGSFENTEDPFSLTPSEIHTEKWYIWVMTDADDETANATNPWFSYGTNDSTLTDAQRIRYRYPVPNEQKKTIFAFVSVQSAKKNNTFGNFLDGINFKLYHPLHGSTTPNGSASVNESDDKGNFSGSISATQDLSAYIPNGSSYTIQATIAEADKATVTFAGVYYTVPDGQGGSKTTFISSEDAGFVKSGSETGPGSIDYTYQLMNVRSSVSLHFVFIKSPEITFDANGGIPYQCPPDGNNYYDFAPKVVDGEMTYTPPYTFSNAVGYEGWLFCGWQLNDDDGPKTELGLLSGEHAVACNYLNSQDNQPIKQQNFVVLKAGQSFRGSTQDDNGVVWLRGEKDALYDDVATGLTMVAQWKWRQSFIPETRNQSLSYSASGEGGYVSVTGGSTDENGKTTCYADEGEIITAVATARPNYRFDGWYDAAGNLATFRETLTYREDRQQVNTYYARFTRLYTQTYERQIPGDNG